MKRIAAPMVGGVMMSFFMELLIYPAIYTIWKWWAKVRWAGHPAASPPAAGEGADGREGPSYRRNQGNG